MALALPPLVWANATVSRIVTPLLALIPAGKSPVDRATTRSTVDESPTFRAASPAPPPPPMFVRLRSRTVELAPRLRTLLPDWDLVISGRWAASRPRTVRGTVLTRRSDVTSYVPGSTITSAPDGASLIAWSIRHAVPWVLQLPVVSVLFGGA